MPSRGFDLPRIGGSAAEPLRGLLGRGEIPGVTAIGKPLKPSDTSDHNCVITVNLYVDDVPGFVIVDWAAGPAA
jgi:hypothetical protein